MTRLSPAGAGVAAAAAAFLGWGMTPIYWKSLAAVPAAEILCHRIVWCALFLAAVLAAQGRLGELRKSFSRGSVGWLLLSSALIAANWFLYIYAVNTGRVLQASLGYYINPLVNVLLSCVFLRERLSRRQMVAIALAAAGVGVSLAEFGRLPWISLALAFSFGSYGLVRKVMRTGPMPGLLFETCLLSVPALAWLHLRGGGLLGWADYPAPAPLLLVLAGAVTAAPLMCFTFSVRRLSLVTVGVMQYLAPTCMLLLGALVYGEPLPPARIATFVLIWCGLAVYLQGAVRAARAGRA
ncbi:MAG: EamA family transporter RarD [Desulfovibrionaceae bacterium]